MSATLPGPVMVAAGCGGTGRDLGRFCDLAGLDFVTRTLTLDPARSAPPRRVLEADGGVLTTAATDNPGLAAFLAAELPELVRAGARPYVSVAGSTPGEYVELAQRLARAPGVAGLEISLADPCAVELGRYLPRELFQFGALVTSVRREFPADLPVLVKVRGGTERTADLARGAVEAGATAVVVSSAQPGALRDGTPATLSGPALLPLTLRSLRDLSSQCPDVDLIAAGGVHDAVAALACLGAGAVSVQVGSALFRDPLAVDRIRTALAEHQPAGPPLGDQP